MTNVLPQAHALNAGPWEGLERFERGLAADPTAEVYIVAGGVFDARPAVIAAQIAVPRAAFKILVVLHRGQGPEDANADTRVYAVEMPNTASVGGTSWRAYATTVDAVERDTGYDFLNRIPGDVQNVIESKALLLPLATAEVGLEATY